MTTIAPGGALHEGPVRVPALLPGMGFLRPVLRPVLGPVVRPVRPDDPLDRAEVEEAWFEHANPGVRL